MSVEELDVIDFLSIDLNGNVVLTISDHLEWNDKSNHLFVLQDKINTYLNSIESDDLYKKYPNAKGRKIRIHIVAKYKPNETGHAFLQRVEEFLKESGYELSFKVIQE